MGSRMRTPLLVLLLVAAPSWAAEDARSDQSIRLGRISYKLYGDPDFELDARASSGLPVRLTATGDCSMSGGTGETVHILGAGKCLVTARQPGDERYRPAPDVELRIPIGKAGQSIDFPEPPPLTYLDPDLDLDARASSSLPVTYFVYGDCAVDGPWLHLLAAGECTVTAHQTGDDNFTAARIVERRIPILRAEQTISFAACPSCGRNTLPIVAVASSGLPVHLAAYGACAAGTRFIHILATGACTVLARQPGSANFNAAPPLEQTFQVVKVE